MSFEVNRHQRNEDFWARQANVQTHTFELTPFGVPTTITANQPEVLAAARLSAGRFSQTSELDGQPIRLQLVVDRRITGPVPANLPERLVYQGVGEWITLSAGEWGHGFANLQARQAVLVLSPALAAETRLVSRYFIDHYLLNFILSRWAMLHASCVVDIEEQRLIVMIAPHNTGKSTTALHLVRAGYHFLADGMALLRQQGEGFVVGGYPIGEVKLRDDAVACFPDYTEQAVEVREHRKTVVCLRSVHSDRVVETTIKPSSIQLYLFERTGSSRTQFNPLSSDEIWPLLTANTVYWDEPDRLAHNTATLRALLRVGSYYRLEIGTDAADIIATIERLR